MLRVNILLMHVVTTAEKKMSFLPKCRMPAVLEKPVIESVLIHSEMALSDMTLQNCF